MENLAKPLEVQCELHCHTSYSWDCELPVQSVIRRVVEKGIDVLAITDHNEIAGALEAQRLAPASLRIIVGEEISTQEGHIIGLFLQQKIEPHLSVKATIQAIKQQGGLVLVPHPFDRVRGGLGEKNILMVLDDIDFIEVFNARVLFPEDNIRALEFAKQHGLASYVGSDSHTAGEYGNATCTIEQFSTQSEFLVALRDARFTTRLSGFKVYLLSEYVKIKKRMKRLFRS